MAIPESSDSELIARLYAYAEGSELPFMAADLMRCAAERLEALVGNKALLRREHRSIFRIDRFEHCWWLFLGKYVVRIGKPWGCYEGGVWEPLFSFWKLWK